MLAATGSIGPLSNGGGGSAAWAIVAIVAFIVFLAVTWAAGLWGDHASMSERHETLEQPTIERKAA